MSIDENFTLDEYRKQINNVSDNYIDFLMQKRIIEQDANNKVLFKFTKVFKDKIDEIVVAYSEDEFAYENQRNELNIMFSQLDVIYVEPYDKKEYIVYLALREFVEDNVPLSEIAVHFLAVKSLAKRVFNG